jgi:hypothetical protein
MAKLKESVVGKLVGKIGQVVGSTWKGIGVLRLLPASIANPRSDKQQTQRQKWSVTMHFLKQLSEFLQIGFKQYEVGMTGINAAMGYNIKNAMQRTSPNITMDYPDARVAQGNLPSALN